MLPWKTFRGPDDAVRDQIAITRGRGGINGFVLLILALGDGFCERDHIIENDLPVLARRCRSEGAATLTICRGLCGGRSERGSCIDKNGDPEAAARLVHRWLCRGHPV